MSRLKDRPMRVFGVIVGAFLSSIALKIFVRNASLLPSGVTGVTTLIQREVDVMFGWSIPFGPLYLVLNVLIFLLVAKHIGKKFMALSFVHIIFTSIFVSIIPEFTLTNDIILLAIFGGILNGLGVTLALKMGGSSGGIDFISIYYSTVKNKPMWDKVLMFNIALLIYNGYRFDWTLSFYSIIYQFVSTEILSNYHDRYKLSSLRIITVQPEPVSEAILKVVRHGITRFEGMGVYHRQSRYMLYMVVNSFEINDVLDAVKNADPTAFIEISNVYRIEGNFRQKPID